MPNGTVANITGSSNPDLFYGLRVSVLYGDSQHLIFGDFFQGGFNNFVRDGIVSRIPVYMLTCYRELLPQ
jgi:hypothetical protein